VRFLISPGGKKVRSSLDEIATRVTKEMQHLLSSLYFTVVFLYRLTAVGILCADHVTPSIRKKLALTSPTGGCRSVGIVRSRTKAMDFSF
jgi:hypothetical protein